MFPLGYFTLGQFLGGVRIIIGASVSEPHIDEFDVNFLYFYISIFLYIIDSVESICRDTTYTQYMPIQKNLSKSQKRYTYKPL